jgi:hypothetical protein
VTYPKVKLCPECASEPSLYAYDNWIGQISSWRVECDHCGYIGSCEGRKLDAIRAHNARILDHAK